jgi:prepilin-type N-terminal cleavage/methylation domain-containing protein
VGSQNKLKLGFTIIEVLVAILLLSTVILIATGFVLPLQVTRQSSIQTSALAYGRAYIELVKIRWTDSAAYTAATTNLPTVSNNGTNADIKMPAGWVLQVNSTTWTSTQNIRTVTVSVRPVQGAGESTADWQRRWVEVSTLITRP